MEAVSGILTTRIPKGNDKAKVISNKSFKSSQLEVEYEIIENIDTSKLDKYMLKKGDVIVMCIEPFRVAYITEDNILATNVLLKIVDKNLSGKEIFKLLNTSKFKKHIAINTEGTTIKRLSSKHINEFNYTEEDYKNAELYFELLELIENQNQQLKDLSLLAKMLCQ